MSNQDLRNITNSFQDVRLASLSSWPHASQIEPRDRGGPYVVLQEGYDPEDLKFIPDEFILGHSGQWVSLGLFYQMPVPERRVEFVFGTVAEVMQVMSNLAPKVQILRPGATAAQGSGAPEMDEMAEALRSGKTVPLGSAAAAPPDATRSTSATPAPQS